jgi:hypothetical protein
MGRPRMVVMEIQRNVVTQRLVSRHGFFEKPFLNITRKIRPQPQCSLSNKLRESGGVAGHGFWLSS